MWQHDEHPRSKVQKQVMLIRPDVQDVRPTVQVLAIGMADEGPLICGRQREGVGEGGDGTKLPPTHQPGHKFRANENGKAHKNNRSHPQHRCRFNLPQRRNARIRGDRKRYGDDQQGHNQRDRAAALGRQM